MLIGRELPCILDDTLNEVNVSTPNTMNDTNLSEVLKASLLSLGFLVCSVQPQGASAVWHQQPL